MQKDRRSVSEPDNQDRDKTNGNARRVNVQRNVLAHNESIADRNRSWLKQRGVVALNLISSPGSGKTTLLQKTLERLRNKIGCAVIVGDQSTDNDARRLRGRGAKVHQIETKTSCHLNAEQIAAVLPEVVSDGVKLLFIENVGNLVCPAAFDLGEDFKIALVSTPEGEDKAVKYPVLFTDAKAVIITKLDLVPHLTYDLEACRQAIRQVQPNVTLFELSAATDDGLDAWIDYLVDLTEK